MKDGAGKKLNQVLTHREWSHRKWSTIIAALLTGSASIHQAIDAVVQKFLRILGKS